VARGVDFSRHACSRNVSDLIAKTNASVGRDTAHAVEYDETALIAFDGIKGVIERVREEANRLASGATGPNLESMS